MAFGTFFRSFFFFSNSETALSAALPPSVGINFDIDEFNDLFDGPHTRIRDLESILADEEDYHYNARSADY